MDTHHASRVSTDMNVCHRSHIVRCAHTRALFLVSLMGTATVLLAACGPTGNGGHVLSPSSTPTPSASASPGRTSSSLPSIPTAKPLTGSSSVNVATTLYAGSDPCSAVGKSEDLTAAPLSCQLLWLNDSQDAAALSIIQIPGNTLPSTLQLPTTASFASGVSSTTAQADALAYLRNQAQTDFWTASNEPDILAELDTPAYASHDWYFGIWDKNEQVVTVPSCALPETISVVPLSSTAATWFGATGSSTVGPDAIVATYPACGGVTVQKVGSRTTIAVGGSSTAASVVVIGEIVNTSTFGPIWVDAGEADCGPSALFALCGGTS